MPTPGQSLPPFTFKTSRYHLALAQLPLLKEKKKKQKNLSISLSLLLLLLCPKGSSEEPSYKFNFQATLKHLFQKCVLFVSGTRRLFRALAWPSGPPPECFAPSDAVLRQGSPVLAPEDTIRAGRLESPGQPMGGAPRRGSLEVLSSLSSTSCIEPETLPGILRKQTSNSKTEQEILGLAALDFGRQCAS